MALPIDVEAGSKATGPADGRRDPPVLYSSGRVVIRSGESGGAPPERAPEKAAGGKKDLHKFLMKLALKKAMRDAKARPPAPPDEEVRQ